MLSFFNDNLKARPTLSNLTYQKSNSPMNSDDLKSEPNLPRKEKPTTRLNLTTVTRRIAISKVSDWILK